MKKNYDFKKEGQRHTFRPKKQEGMLKELCKIERLLPKKMLHKLPYTNPLKHRKWRITPKISEIPGYQNNQIPAQTLVLSF